VKFGGLDLAAREKNPSGVAIIDSRKILVTTLYSDMEIIDFFERENPSIVGIDAPLTLREDRYADKYLRKYGAMSLKLPGIKELASRALKLKEKIEEKRIKVIEVFPTATAKILGFYRKPKKLMLSYFKNYHISDVRNEHEMDAIIAAYTVYLYHKGLTLSIDGVIIPKE